MGGVGGCVSRVVGWMMMWAGGWARWLDGWDGGGLAALQAGWLGVCSQRLRDSACMSTDDKELHPMHQAGFI